MLPETELRNQNTLHIDRVSPLEVLTLINAEDQKVAQVINGLLPDIARAVEAITVRMRQGGRLIYAGSGTSGRLGIQDAVECVPTFSSPPGLVQGIIAGGERALVRAVEGAEDRADDGRRDLLALNPTALDTVVGIAASGTTPYVIGVLTTAREIGALTVALACNAPAPILELAEHPLAAVVGPEVITGSTRMKAGTAQKMILNMLSTSVMIGLGKVYGNLMVDVQVTNQKLAQRAKRIVAEVVGCSVETAADLLQQTGNEVKTAIVVGRLQVSPEEARARLKAAQGILHQVIGGAA